MRTWIVLVGLSLASTSIASESPPPDHLRVVSYNIALGAFIKLENTVNAQFLKRRFSIARFLQSHSALKDFDVIGLQEICKGRHDEQPEYFRAILRHRGLTPYSRFAAASPLSNDGCMNGQMILSRYPIVDSGTFELPLLRPGGKVVLWVDIAVPGHASPFRFYNLHLDNRGKSLFAEAGRWKQMQTVLSHYREWQADHPGSPAIILGDFNALNRLYNFWEREKTIRETMKVLSPSLDHYKATHITAHQTDWIFFQNLKLSRSQVAYRMRSDHFPVAADFDLKP